MNLNMFDPEYYDMSNDRVLIGISGGINSAALLCFLATEYPEEFRPKEVYLFIVQLEEHSPDTFKFMKDCVRYASSKFDKVRWHVRWGSVLKFFENQNMIPHPILSPCSEQLKILPMLEYSKKHNITLDLVGYVRHERSRINRQSLKSDTQHYYPIAHLSDDDCFDIVKQEIGWYPAIYDIKEWRGKQYKRVFNHNNCLPCKNMSGYLAVDGDVSGQYKSVQLYYPEYFNKAVKISQEINSYWGRLKNDDNSDFGFCPICELL